MSRATEIYFEIYAELIDNNCLIEICDNPIKNYLKLLSNAPILEIGSGTGSDTLCLGHLGKQVVCVEKEESVIGQLKSRIDKYALENGIKLNITLLNQTFPNITLPNSEYSCVVISNLLHFFEYETAAIHVEKAKSLVEPEGYIYIKAHSKNHPFNKQPGHYPHYKHFYDETELVSFFNSEFQIIDCSQIITSPSQLEKDIKSEWIKRYWEEFCREKNNTTLDQLKLLNPLDDPEISIELLVKRKGLIGNLEHSF